MREKNASCLSTAGGLAALLSILSLGLTGCATTQIQEAPAPTERSVEALIYEWDKTERTQPACPSAYRDVFVKALHALNDALAEVQRERARQ